LVGFSILAIAMFPTQVTVEADKKIGKVNKYTLGPYHEREEAVANALSKMHHECVPHLSVDIYSVKMRPDGSYYEQGLDAGEKSSAAVSVNDVGAGRLKWYDVLTAEFTKLKEGSTKVLANIEKFKVWKAKPENVAGVDFEKFSVKGYCELTNFRAKCVMAWLCKQGEAGKNLEELLLEDEDGKLPISSKEHLFDVNTLQTKLEAITSVDSAEALEEMVKEFRLSCQQVTQLYGSSNAAHIENKRVLDTERKNAKKEKEKQERQANKDADALLVIECKATLDAAHAKREKTFYNIDATVFTQVNIITFVPPNEETEVKQVIVTNGRGEWTKEEFSASHWDFPFILNMYDNAKLWFAEKAIQEVMKGYLGKHQKQESYLIEGRTQGSTLPKQGKEETDTLFDPLIALAPAVSVNAVQGGASFGTTSWLNGYAPTLKHAGFSPNWSNQLTMLAKGNLFTVLVPLADLAKRMVENRDVPEKFTLRHLIDVLECMSQDLLRQISNVLLHFLLYKSMNAVSNHMKPVPGVDRS
jgi:hypothetical protein